MKFFIVCALALVCQFVIAQTKPQIAFRISEKDLIPEGMTYDPVSREFFVGSIQKKKVVRISASGKVSDYKPSIAAGLFDVLGMTVKNEMLWVCNNSPEYDTTRFISCLHIFDLKKETLWKKYILNDGKKHLFNDVVVTNAGVGFVTDSDGGAVYRISPGSDTVETFLPPGSLRYPNGIALSSDEKKLFVSTGSGLGIVSVDLQSKVVTPLQNERFLLIGNDGLYRYKNSLIGVQNVTFPEAILQYRCNEDFTAIHEIIPRAVNLPEFDSPTTGVVVGDYFYFIANSQLLQLIGQKGQLKKPGELKETLIMRVSLE